MPIDKRILDLMRKNDESLTNLKLQNAMIFPNEMQELADLLLHTCNLVSIDLSKCMLSDMNLSKLQLALYNNKTLRILNLSSNGIGANGAEYIGDLIKINKSIVSLDLTDNKLGLDGAKCIGNAIAANEDSNLSTLSLKGNCIKNGAKYIFSLLKNNIIVNLNLSGNQLTAASIENLILDFDNNTSLRYLDLSWNNIDSETLLDIVSSILSNTNSFLSTLDLCQNKKMTGPQLKRLDSLFSVNKKIFHLRLPKDNFASKNCDINLSSNGYYDYAHPTIFRIREIVHQQDNFVRCMIVLARDHLNASSNTLWHRIPQDIKFIIIDYLILSLINSFNKNERQLEECALFIFRNIEEINFLLKTEQTLRIGEKKVGESFYSFRFFCQGIQRKKNIDIVKENPSHAVKKLKN